MHRNFFLMSRLSEYVPEVLALVWGRNIRAYAGPTPRTLFPVASSLDSKS